MNWDVNRTVTVRAAWHYLRYVDENNAVTNTIQPDGLTYTQAATARAQRILGNSGEYVYVDTNFTTGVLRPARSDQYEVGAKATVGQALLSAAWFRINRENFYDRVNADGTHTFADDGREVHDGVEFTVNGGVAPRVRVLGGVTLFDATVKHAANTAILGKEPAHVSEQMVKAYAEYDVPFLNGLTVTGGAYFTGSFFADATNLQKLPGVWLGDVGARFATRLGGRPLVLRLTMNNVANASYWLSGNWVGDPRRVAFSAQTQC
jgi:iron complex outermembrane receptor protein